MRIVILKVCLRWREPASACTEKQENTRLGAHFSTRSTKKTFNFAPQDCFWPGNPSRRKRKPSSIPLAQTYVFFSCLRLKMCSTPNIFPDPIIFIELKFCLIGCSCDQMQPHCDRERVSNCLTCIIDTVFNVSPALAMVTTAENRPESGDFSARQPSSPSNSAVRLRAVESDH